ncbi:conserved hypothetical protein [Theileria orientalis strain Shintoku]|uniref:RNA-editing substrate-binding complex 8 protein HEAT repeats domain-containing protein n=1 Tax=Theileria orientalis strain Shintoku TaxID=869250 RepID=J4C7M5_THEOR|nr:conserved hypothetical protein [Theileria orientalis strain Shintoku]BAM39298.1 conserved hypothetical protein [Theileria orientalis strain Shintoku]|eukprot:XP_009689599.1 conserved hypothetical protein [Theileria orientalis strain Shintoku]
MGLRTRSVGSQASRRGGGSDRDRPINERLGKEEAEVTDSAELVRRIYKLARTGQTSVELWRECTARTVEYMDKLDLRGVCSILHSYGYMKYRDRSMLELMAGRLIENVRMLNCAQIASALRAYSILNFRSDFLFRLAMPEISLRMDMMTVGQVASIFYSYANLGYYNRNLYRSIQSYMYKNLEQVGAYDLTLLLNGHCRNQRGFDARFLTVLSFQFCKMLDTFDNKLFSQSVNALSRLGFCNHKYLPGLIESEVYSRVKGAREALPSKSISLILNALSRHYESCTPLFTFLSQNVLKRIKEYDLHSLCLALSAFSRVSLSDAKTYDKIAEYIGRNSLKLYPRAIASMLYSYARAKHLHGPLFYFSGKHVEVNLDKYSCDEMAMILRSFALLNVKNEGVMSAVSEYIVKNTPDYVTVKFEDQCADERVHQPLESKDRMSVGTEKGKGEKNKKSHECEKSEDNEENEECEGFNINLLEVVEPTSHESSNYLANGKTHSLLWVVEAYAKFLHVNDQVTRALTRIANELVVRMGELTPPLVSRFLHSFTQLGFRHTACLEMLLNEVANPRIGFKFDQKDLALIHNSIKSYRLSPRTYGVYRFNRLDFQKVVEKHRSEEGGTLRIIRRIVTEDVPASKPLYLELLTNPLTEKPRVTDEDDLHEDDLHDEEGNVQGDDLDDDEDDTDVIYVHIPEHVRRLVEVDDADCVNRKLSEAIDNHINYNFNLD